MVEWVETPRGIRAVGSEGDVEVGTTAWRPATDERALPSRVDAGVVGSATGLYLPTTALSLAGREIDPPAMLPAGEHLLTFDAEVETLVRLAGPARIVGIGGDGAGVTDAVGTGDTVADAVGGDGDTVAHGVGEGAGVAVRFGDRTPITLGFRDGNVCPPTVTVPPTPEGVATALSQLPAAHRTGDPRRSHPAYRDHPPLVAFGDEDVPRRVREAVPDTGIELLVPGELDYLLVAAPLGYYLGATVRISDGPPLLQAPGAGFERCFSRLPCFEGEAADLLRRVVFLDSLVRDLNDPPSAQRAFGLDPDLTERQPDERLRAYASLPADEVRTRLPDWHLSTYVAPRTENVRALPYLLDRLSLVYLPEASELDCNELLKRTLDGFYRGDVASVDVLDPELGVGRMHAWLADGTPIDAFKTSKQAHENRLTERTSPERVHVAVVHNEPEMTCERAVGDLYREHTGPVVDVSVHEQLRRDELAEVLERPNDFVHYVGHCEVDGLCCADGFLAAGDLDRSRTRAFFLNACGSYHQGWSLVERGSVVGAVTLTRVLDEQAGTVGTAFARLLAGGFDVASAIRLARRRIMMGKDYVVVGDGTYSPVPRYGDTAVVRLERSSGGFDVRYDVVCPRSAGRSYRDPFDGDRRPYGDSTVTHLDREELASFLEGRSLPVLYDGDLRWATDVAASLHE